MYIDFTALETTNPDTHSPVVLVVEYFESIRNWMKLRLERSGFTVVTAKCGAEAIVMSETHKPEVIVVDLDMPLFDGMWTIRQLKSSHTTREVPVIATSASKLYAQREQALAEGCVAYLRKSVDTAELESLVSEQSAMHRRLSTANESQPREEASGPNTYRTAPGPTLEHLLRTGPVILFLLAIFA
jgi:two-component system, cell cycle response regulator DivK